MTRHRHTVIFAAFFLSLGFGTLMEYLRSDQPLSIQSQFIILYAMAIMFASASIRKNGLLGKISPILLVLVLSVFSPILGSRIARRILIVMMVAFTAEMSLKRPFLYIAMSFHLGFVISAARFPTPWEHLTKAEADASVAVLVIVGVVATYLTDLAIRSEQKRLESYEKIGQLNQTVQNLSAVNIEYSTFAQLARHQALLEERNRITREIHDSIGYTLTNIVMLSEAIITHMPEEQGRIRGHVDSIRQQAKTGLFDTRRALRMMREAEEGLPRGIDAMEKLVEVFRSATGVSASLEILAPRRKVENETIFLTIYRFVQEALTNSFRHGCATEVAVRIFDDGKWLYVTVWDNGTGVTNLEEGIGIKGMRERIDFLGGELRFWSRDGFVVTATIPVQEST